MNFDSDIKQAVQKMVYSNALPELFPHMLLSGSVREGATLARWFQVNKYLHMCLPGFFTWKVVNNLFSESHKSRLHIPVLTSP